ncbi:MAG: GatB/YqeY domain-containing protein [Alphaproteobacteria bacterium]|nr:GatB/YqeY domain-containing protein [Alphaproteobacteria bacterium]
MLRQRLNDGLKTALKAKEARRVSTIRLILAALKDRDIGARTADSREGISDEEIMNMLQTMVRQRRESIALYEQGARMDLAQQEQEEIEVIESFLPRQLSDEEIGAAVTKVVAEVGAKGIKDMGRTIAALKQQYAGQMDFSKAAQMVKRALQG